MTSQLDQWKGAFGDDYTNRNNVDPNIRVDWFKKNIPPDVNSVLEYGANRGHNLIAIDKARPDIWTVGVEPNAHARRVALEEGVRLYDGDIYTTTALFPFELVLTSGVLIHVPPKRLNGAMRTIYNATTRYILAIEYRRDTDTMIEYRGYQDMLWARDYGAHYTRLFPDLQLVQQGPLTETDGFKDSWHWILSK